MLDASGTPTDPRLVKSEHEITVEEVVLYELEAGQSEEVDALTSRIRRSWSMFSDISTTRVRRALAALGVHER